MSSDIISATANVVAGYAARNDTTPEILADLIPASLQPGVGRSLSAWTRTMESRKWSLSGSRPRPRGTIEESVHDDHLVCWKTGGAHVPSALSAKHYGLSPELYRKRWACLPTILSPHRLTRRRREIWANMQGRK